MTAIVGKPDFSTPQAPLVLSLFPGIDLLGRAFELEGFCVVRGPDPAIGTGDIRDFNPPRTFTGIIAGPPCQDFSVARRIPATGEGIAMLNQCVRIIEEVIPAWWLIENVPTVPDIRIEGYTHQRIDLRANEFGLRQSRLRHFQFGSRFFQVLIVERGPEVDATEACAMACEGEKASRRTWSNFCELQGLEPDFDLPYFTQAARYRAVGNGVPLPMGRAIARVIYSGLVHQQGVRVCRCGCGRRVTGKQSSAGPACRKRIQRNSFLKYGSNFPPGGASSQRAADPGQSHL